LDEAHARLAAAERRSADLASEAEAERQTARKMDVIARQERQRVERLEGLVRQERGQQEAARAELGSLRERVEREAGAHAEEHARLTRQVSELQKRLVAAQEPRSLPPMAYTPALADRDYTSDAPSLRSPLAAAAGAAGGGGSHQRSPPTSVRTEPRLPPSAAGAVSSARGAGSSGGAQTLSLGTAPVMSSALPKPPATHNGVVRAYSMPVSRDPSEEPVRGIVAEKIGLFSTMIHQQRAGQRSTSVQSRDGQADPSSPTLATRPLGSAGLVGRPGPLRMDVGAKVSADVPLGMSPMSRSR